MTCPQCHAQYRDGFTRCFDCDTALVDAPPQSGNLLAIPSAGDPDEDPFCEFWKGTDDRLHAELLEILGEAHIPCKTLRRSDRLFNFTSFTAFRLGVPFSFFERAERAVKAAYEQDPASEAATRISSRHLLPPSSN